MLNSVLGSFISLWWSFALLLFIFTMFALVFVQGTSSFMIEHGHTLDKDSFDRIMECFGSVEKAMLTLYRAVTGGADWEVFYDNPGVIVHTGPMNTFLFIF